MAASGSHPREETRSLVNIPSCHFLIGQVSLKKFILILQTVNYPKQIIGFLADDGGLVAWSGGGGEERGAAAVVDATAVAEFPLACAVEVDVFLAAVLATEWSVSSVHEHVGAAHKKSPATEARVQSPPRLLLRPHFNRERYAAPLLHLSISGLVFSGVRILNWGLGGRMKYIEWGERTKEGGFGGVRAMWGPIPRIPKGGQMSRWFHVKQNHSWIDNTNHC